MGTTSLEAATAVISSLKDLNVEWALLHGADELPYRQQFSDLDIVLDRPPRILLRALRESLAHRGYVPIILSRHDAGETSFLFVCNKDATEGVQLDLLYDPNGLGGLRLPSPPLLHYVQERGPMSIPSLTPEAEAIYLWRKSLGKRDMFRLGSLRQSADSLDQGSLVKASRELTGSEHDARSLLSGHPVVFASRSPLTLFAQIPRGAERLIHPRGFWVHMQGPGQLVAQELSSRFSHFLFVSTSFKLTESATKAVGQYLQRISLTRRRAALIATWGASTRLNRPDLVIEDLKDVDKAARRLTEAMDARLKRIQG